MQLLTSAEDVQWARDVHKVPTEATGVILIGNEDCPEAVWYTVDAVPNHLFTVYGRLGSSANSTPAREDD